MWPCLLIALALLGTVPISRSALASPAVEDEEDVTELEMPEEYSECLGTSDKQAVGVPSVPGTATCRYVLISRCRSFCQAQRICAQRFNGRLASIHDSCTNNYLLHLARQQCNAGQVWIGVVNKPPNPCNYTHWAPGNPLPGSCFCTALCTRDGFWRSVPCNKQLPFICEK